MPELLGRHDGREQAHREEALSELELLRELELFTERDLGRPLSRHRIGRIEWPASLTFIGPIVRACVALLAPEEAIATRAA